MTSDAGSPRVLEIERIERTSLTRKAREVILELILTRDLGDGRLPAEGVLAEKLGVSRTTVRSALQSLQQDGFITRRRGSGTVVNRNVVPARLGLHRLVGFSKLLAEAAHAPTVEIEARMQRSLPLDWAERLNAGTECEVHVLDKLFLADGQPAISVTDVIPLASLRSELDDEIPDSIFELFNRSGRQPVDHAVVELAARNASAAVARRLGLKPGAAYLALVESHYAAGQPDPVALSFIDVNGAYVGFDVVRRTA